MKRLNKILINPERIMKNKELISLKGGANCWCWYGEEPGEGGVCMTGTASDFAVCEEMCEANTLCQSATFSGQYYKLNQNK